MHDLARQQTTIDSVRVLGARGDALSLRWAMTPALATLDPRLPASWPPSTIVCVRRLRDPMPGRWRSASWQAAARRSLESLIARAALPAQEAVPANAEAVVFFDLVEMLVCLARDLANGAAARWWWRSLLDARPPQEALLAHWSDAPETLPPSFVALTTSGHLTRALASIDPRPLGPLALHVARAHGIDGSTVQALVGLALTPPPLPRSSASSHPSHDHDDHSPPLDVTPPTATSLRAALSDIPRELLTSPFGELVALAFALRRAPTALRLLRANREHAASLAEPRTALLRAVPPATAGSEEAMAPVSRPSSEASTHAANGSDALATRDPRPTARHTRDDAPRADGVDPRTSPRVPSPTRTGRDEQVLTDVAPPSPQHAPPQLDACASPTPGDDAVVTVWTRLGGVFYLVNVLLALELYPDFATPLRPALHRSLWALIACLARELLRDPLPGDAVWTLLARLTPDARDDDASIDPAAWAVRPAWLAAFDRAPWTWGALSGRLVVTHPVGFAVLDEPCAQGCDVAYVTDRLRDLGLDDDHGGLTHGDAPPLGTWAARLAGYVRARLAVAMPEIDLGALGETVIAHEATIHTTATRVDVTLSLAALPVAVRRAGLDRDVGWLPSAGRSLYFHFDG